MTHRHLIVGFYALQLAHHDLLAAPFFVSAGVGSYSLSRIARSIGVKGSFSSIKVRLCCSDHIVIPTSISQYIAGRSNGLQARISSLRN
jgi:hypothetical protein